MLKSQKMPEKLDTILNTNAMKTCKIIGFCLRGTYEAPKVNCTFIYLSLYVIRIEDFIQEKLYKISKTTPKF